ncbi:DUF3857 domain-containing protein [Candidatus Dependentiae bacterium]|nr:DUF3857 domain-containing protein [Candidatus Dependentiae bacterium]
MKKKLLLYFLIISATTFFKTSHADILLLNDGREYSGKISEIKNDILFFEIPDSEEKLKFHLSEVKTVNLQKQRKWHIYSNIKDIAANDEILKKYTETEISADSYPNAGIITLYSNTEYKQITGNTYKIKYTVLKKILQKRGESQGINNYYYYSLYDSPSIEFAISINDKGIVKHLDDNALKDEEIYSEQLYNNLKRLRFSLPETKPGSYIYYSTETIRKYDSYIFPFYINQIFREAEPVIFKNISIDIPESKEINYFVNDTSVIKININNFKGRKILEFSAENLDQYYEEQNIPPYREVLPSLVATEKKTWDEIVYNFANIFYSKLEKNNYLTFINESLKIQEKTSFEKLSAIYDFMLKNFETFSISPLNWNYGFYDLKVLSNSMSGNYFDKILFMMALLKNEGIESHFVLCRTGESGKISMTANLKEFNKAICKVQIQDKTYFLAPFDKTSPIGNIPFELHNTEAVEILNQKEYKFIKLPESKTIENDGIHKKIFIKIRNDNFIECEETIKFHGNFSIDMRSAVLMNNEEIKKMFENMVSSIHNNAELLEYRLGENNSDSNEFVINYKYSIRNYCISAGDKIKCFRVPGVVQTGFDFNKTDRDFDIKWYGNEFHKIEAEIILPENYNIYYIPEKLNISFKDISFTGKYDVNEGCINYNSDFSRKTDYIEKSNYSELRNLYLSMAVYSQEWIVLSKK